MKNTFEQLVFSGGGTRCFWQGGFLEEVTPAIELDPKRICTVSGGALAACCHIAGRGKKLLETMGSAFQEQDFNVNQDAMEDGESVAPHQEIYRNVVSETLDNDAIAAIADGPQLQITLALPPAKLPLKAGAFLALALYEIDQHTRSSPHMAYPVSIGTRQLHVDANQAAKDGRLIDLVCAAAVIPPVFDFPKWKGDYVMDAGSVDNAPMPQPDEGKTLILLTRRYRNTPDEPNRLYVDPSDETPADKIDFTDRQKLQDTWEMGRRDGERFLKTREID